MISSYGKYIEDDESRFNFYCKMYAQNATVYYGTSLLSRMNHPSFVVRTIESSEADGGELVRIGYAYEGKYIFESGTVVLDTGKKWAIRGVELAITSKKEQVVSTLKISVDYKKVDDSNYFPTHTDQLDTGPNPKYFEHMIFDLDTVTIGDVPDSIFQMSTYGLPDLPLQSAPRPSLFTPRNPMVWLALAASVASFAMIRYLRSRDRRRGRDAG